MAVSCSANKGHWLLFIICKTAIFIPSSSPVATVQKGAATEVLHVKVKSRNPNPSPFSESRKELMEESRCLTKPRQSALNGFLICIEYKNGFSKIKLI